MSRVLIAGATGYLGGYVARACVRRGHHVRALVRSRDRAGSLAGEVAEVVEGQVTQPETLARVCAGVEMVFSSVGITRQRDGLTFRDVDYQGNLNLLEAAKAAGVSRFVYVSVLHGPGLTHLAIVKAHEHFVSDLRRSGLEYVVLRPTAYFSDLGAFLAMARKGRVYLVGKGANRVNPIHGADLAESCVDAFEGRSRELDVGGPEILTYRSMADLAFQVLDESPRVTTVPLWVMRSVTALTKLFTDIRASCWPSSRRP